jgi:hypothetical protein
MDELLSIWKLVSWKLLWFFIWQDASPSLLYSVGKILSLLQVSFDVLFKAEYFFLMFWTACTSVDSANNKIDWDQLREKYKENFNILSEGSEKLHELLLY